MSDQTSTGSRVSQVLYQDDDHQFIWLGAGDPESEMGISSNQYLIVDGGEATILDPGGFHVFERVFESTLEYVELDQVKRLFFSHQDPDICVSLVSWLEACPEVDVTISGLWERFILHLALPVMPKMVCLPDEGGVSFLPSGAYLQYVPAHFLHAPGNFHVYDSRAKMLFTGDLGAAVVPDDDTDFEVTDFDAHVPHMEGFHLRYMGSTKALQAWLERVRSLEIDAICPQHGKIFTGDNVGRFLDWLGGLKVGMEYKRWGD